MIGLLPNPGANYPENWAITSIIDPGADVHQTVLIAHFAYIMGGAKIGPWCIIGAHCVIGESVTLGQNVQVMSHVNMEACEIENDVFIGAGAYILNMKHPRAGGPEPKEDPVLICEGAAIGAAAVILPGVTIGQRAMVGAGAIVTKDLPAGQEAKSPAAQVYR